jgi:hypothetical protein
MKTIAVGALIPLGLSRWKDVLDEGWQIRFPIFIWHGLHWDCHEDAKCDGWVALHVLLKRQRNGINFRYGWVLVKRTGPWRETWGQ